MVRGIALALGMLAVGLATPPPMLALGSGQVRVAATALRRALETDPDNADLHARLGIVYSRMGLYADAVEAFRFGLGSGVYEAEGIEHHAEALRGLGRGREAAALRQELLVMVTSEKSELDLRIGAVEDLRVGGALEEAEALARDTAALFPRSNLAHAWLADVLLDQDRLEDAAFELWLIRDHPAQSTRAVLARARLLWLEGDVEAAWAEVEQVRRGNRTQPVVVMLRVDLLLARGEPEEALWELRRPMMSRYEHPGLQASEVRVLRALGEDDEAAALAARLAAQYPWNPDVVALSEE